jgi:hypothetical protein
VAFEGIAALALLWASTVLGVAGAPVPLRAIVKCERALSPGRVRCEAEAHAEGAKITWGDVEIVKVSPSLSALKGRIGPSDATLKTEDTWRWGFALVARERGVGQIEARVRAVVCVGTACVPETATVIAEVMVGEKAP